MRVLSLFAGLDGQGAAFRERGHEVITYDMDPRFTPDYLGDLSEIWELPKADVALVGFPCNCFSVASFGHHWTGGYRAYQPKTEEAKNALRLLDHVKNLLTNPFLKPVKMAAWENPVCLFRRFMEEYQRVTIWQCRYGESRAKPTDLFLWPPFALSTFEPKPPCHNGNPDHEEARRGAKTGTQGIKGSAERAKWPYQLSLDLCIAFEKRILA